MAMKPFRTTAIGYELITNLAILTGMRDRLRCPRCHAVGTWKPHGGWYDRRHGDERAVRRWMCKCCGLYQGPEGIKDVLPNVDEGYWDFVRDGNRYGDTPLKILQDANLWPWHG